MRKRAVAYKRGSRVVICPESETTAGVWILDSPAVVGSTDLDRLGKQLIEALGASRRLIPHPTVWSGLFDPVLHAAGVRSYSTFMKSALGVGASWSEVGVHLTPYRNLGRKEGFDHIDSKTMMVSNYTDEQLGAALLSAFENAI
jgi:hypothetical protein